MTRKHLIRTVPLLFIVLVTACSKTGPIAEPIPEPQPATRISKIEHEHYSVNATYHTNGDIATLSNRSIPADPADDVDFIFSYHSGKLNEAVFGGKWKYFYTGTLVTRVQTFNAAGVAKYQTDLVYSNSRVTERTESVITTLGLKPQFQTVYTYDVKGNLAKKEVYQMINGDWDKAEEISYTAYDTHTNTLQVFENNPYVPTALYYTNNPGKETYKDKDGTITGTATYTYTYNDKGYVTARTATHVYPGLPDYVEAIKIFY